MDRKLIKIFSRNIFFIILLPGTVTVFIPYLLIKTTKDISIFQFNILNLFGLIPITIGLSIAIWTFLGFAIRGRGTIAPIDPPENLVIQGLYKYVRNPMYIGVLSILLGESILFNSYHLLAYTFLSGYLFNLFIRIYEEPVLTKKFGQSYKDYSSKTPRWIPKFKLYR